MTVKKPLIHSAGSIAEMAVGDATAVPSGGTGFSSYAVGHLLYADTTATLAKLAGVATGNILISGGANTAPVWGKVGLATHVSDILPGANGGTGVNNTGKTITVAGNLTTTGAFASTFTMTGAYTYTFPGATGTLADIASAQTFTNKTITTPVIGGSPSTTAGMFGYDSVSKTLSFYDGTVVRLVGFLNIPLVSASAATTITKAHAGGGLNHPSADTTARTFTFDSNANQSWVDGTTVTILNQNAAGVLTIAVTTDTMRMVGAGTTGSRTLAANGMATAIWDAATTTWYINGTGLT